MVPYRGTSSTGYRMTPLSPSTPSLTPLCKYVSNPPDPCPPPKKLSSFALSLPMIVEDHP